VHADLLIVEGVDIFALAWRCKQSWNRETWPWTTVGFPTERETWRVYQNISSFGEIQPCFLHDLATKSSRTDTRPRPGVCWHLVQTTLVKIGRLA